ncbi:OmpH family outer membrane protein [Marichromatium sp. AB32]|uniref:OmpH family outer membrane protein n=1 Tax=Marichromatium sp. AB32 TaxID=2483363 RepID=UPI000F3EDC9C|nr:OmpH family outer membrane protein [Marichromatium sp. AB32]MBO8085641.1 OmpH family outer membrane protein [Marichromatium sp.]RNE92563.1 OmpH family outer membrane protein [Marichromatium sp. AB32]
MSRPLQTKALLLALALPLPALAGPSVGYVDMQKVLEESRIGQQVQEQLRKDFEPRGRALAEEEQTLMQMQQSLERDAPLMSEAQVDKQRTELKERIAAYQKEAAQLQRELMKAQQEKGREIVVPAREVVNAIAEKRGLDMVVERGQNGLLYIDEGLDITEAVIERLDDD